MIEAAVTDAPRTDAALGTGQAPGKVILLGEHAVVYGHPALAAGLDRGVTVQVRRGSGGPVLRAPAWNVDARLSEDPAAGPLGNALERVRVAVAPGLRDVVLHADDALPLGAGLGSSAALTVACARALAQAAGVTLDQVRLTDVVQRAEQVFHGNPSGVDQATVVRGGILRFQRRAQAPHDVTEVIPGGVFTVVVALMRPHVGTREAVEGLRVRRERRARSVNVLMAELGALAEEGVGAVRSADWTTLGELADLAHGILNALGVSSDDLDVLVRKGRSLGALGAKLTGAGVGGAVVMVTDSDPARVTRLVDGLRADGAHAFAARLGGASA